MKDGILSTISRFETTPRDIEILVWPRGIVNDRERWKTSDLEDSPYYIKDLLQRRQVRVKRDKE